MLYPVTCLCFINSKRYQTSRLLHLWYFVDYPMERCSSHSSWWTERLLWATWRQRTQTGEPHTRGWRTWFSMWSTSLPSCTWTGRGHCPSGLAARKQVRLHTKIWQRIWNETQECCSKCEMSLNFEMWIKVWNETGKCGSKCEMRV